MYIKIQLADFLKKQPFGEMIFFWYNNVQWSQFSNKHYSVLWTRFIYIYIYICKPFLWFVHLYIIDCSNNRNWNLCYINLINKTAIILCWPQAALMISEPLFFRGGGGLKNKTPLFISWIIFCSQINGGKKEISRCCWISYSIYQTIQNKQK